MAQREASITSKELTNFFYTQCEGEDADYYVCNNSTCKSKQKQKQNTGYTNLKNHLRSCIGPNFENVYRDIVKSSKSKGRLDSYGFINQREKEVHQVVNWIVMRNLPISEVDNEDTRGMLKTESILSKTLRKYVLALTPYVETAIAQDLPDKFGIMFDGWTAGTMHYVAIFASYMKSGSHKEQLLALAPLVDEATLGAQQHIEFMRATLDLYWKSLDNVVVFIGDNCNMNRKISDDTNIPLLGCASHRFNLAVNLWLEDKPAYAAVLTSVHELMVQLRQLKNAARLRTLTHLCAIKNNVTRWSSKYDMAKRYIRLENEIKMIPELEQYVLSFHQRRTSGELIGHLSKFQSITKSLQKSGLSPVVVRGVFDAIIEENEYPEMETYLGPSANIVNNPHFESGLNKILAKTDFSMINLEKLATARLLSSEAQQHSESSSTEEATMETSYFDLLQKRKRRRLSEEHEQYNDCSFCVATSNTVERLFSACKHVLTDTRKLMSPIMFEALIFLKVNRDFWDLAMVAKAMKNNEPRGIQTDMDTFYDEQ